MKCWNWPSVSCRLAWMFPTYPGIHPPLLQLHPPLYWMKNCNLNPFEKKTVWLCSQINLFNQPYCVLSKASINSFEKFPILLFSGSLQTFFFSNSNLFTKVSQIRTLMDWQHLIMLAVVSLLVVMLTHIGWEENLTAHTNLRFPCFCLEWRLESCYKRQFSFVGLFNVLDCGFGRLLWFHLRLRFQTLLFITWSSMAAFKHFSCQVPLDPFRCLRFVLKLTGNIISW